MRSTHRFAFGREPAQLSTVQEPTPSTDKTVPLPVLTATWQDRTTLRLAEVAEPAAPVVPLHVPVAPRMPPPAVPTEASRRRRVGVRVAIGMAALALYTAAVVAVVSPRRGVDAPAVTVPTASALLPVPEVTASAASPAGPSASAAPPAVVATPPRPAPARTPRPPAPARTTQPVSDVRNPWKYD
jgi:hypothetical protein